MKRLFALVVGLVLALVTLMSPGLQAAEKPNIVLAFLDRTWILPDIEKIK